MADLDDLLLQATASILDDKGKLRGTAWLLDDNGHLLTAGHVIGREQPLENVVVFFMDDKTPYPAAKVDWKYDFASGIDCAVLKLAQTPPKRSALPISLAKAATGNFTLFGFGKTLVDLSPAAGSFIGPYHPQNLMANRLFALQTEQSREEGYSGAAIFSSQLNAVVGIQIEGTTVRADVAHGTTVLAMPLFRIAQLFSTLPVFSNALAALADEHYAYHVYLSYDRNGMEEKWLNMFLLDELTEWLRFKFPGGPQIFFDHNPIRNIWDPVVVNAIRRSCCLVAISSPNYWRSPECVAEFESFRARQLAEGAKLVLAIVFQEDDVAPGMIPAATWLDFSKYSFVYEGYRKSAKYGLFQNAVKKLVADLAVLINNAPEYESLWPVATPAAAAAASLGVVRIGRPRL